MLQTGAGLICILFPRFETAEVGIFQVRSREFVFHIIHSLLMDVGFCEMIIDPLAIMSVSRSISSCLYLTSFTSKTQSSVAMKAGSLNTISEFLP